MKFTNPSIQQLLGNFDPSVPPPAVAPVTTASARPRWSVMIPSFNCAKFLRQTLESVLAQDPGSEHMQIEVIDDCSTKDDPEAVVREVGKGRVEFHRKEKNGGAIPNFNTCIERSRGEWVHILHGDDWVERGFYQTIEEKVKMEPTVDGVFTRSLIVSETGEIDTMSNRVPEMETLGSSWDPVFYINPILTPSIVVRRSFYEKTGGFDTRLIHVADWEMWSRIAHLGNLVSVNRPLAYYRFFDGNDTGRLAQSGENLVDYLRLGSIFAHHSPEFQPDRFMQKVAETAYRQKQKFSSLGNQEAYEANRRISHQLGFKNRMMVELPRRLAALVRK